MRPFRRTYGGTGDGANTSGADTRLLQGDPSQWLRQWMDIADLTSRYSCRVVACVVAAASSKCADKTGLV